jgi:hypothetical protein
MSAKPIVGVGDGPHGRDYSEQIDEAKEIYKQNGEEVQFQAELKKNARFTVKAVIPKEFQEECRLKQRLPNVIQKLQDVVDSGDWKFVEVGLRKQDRYGRWIPVDIAKFKARKHGKPAMKIINGYLDLLQKEFVALNARPTHWIMRFTEGHEVQVTT